MKTKWFSRVSLALLIALGSTGLFAAEEKKDEEEKAPTVKAYVDLSPALVANLQGRSYIRCQLQLLTKDESQVDEIKHHAPAMRHALLLLLSDQPTGDMKSPKGKEKVRKDALSAIQTLMKEETGKEMVDDLFFTTYLVQ